MSGKMRTERDSHKKAPDLPRHKTNYKMTLLSIDQAEWRLQPKLLKKKNFKKK